VGGVVFHAASRGNRLRVTGGVVVAYLIVSILHGLWDSMRGIAALLTALVSLASGQLSAQSGAPTAASDTEILLFNLFNFGGIVVVSALGIATLVIISRRWDRPVRQTIRGTPG
jgi:hypothetical protein